MQLHAVRPGIQHAKKFVFIGASYKFDHRVVRDFLLTRRFNGSTFTIVDIDPVPLKLVTDLTRRMVKQSGQDIKIEGTLDLEKALHRADFVFPTFSVGGDKAWEKDAALAYKYGIVSPVGDTIGPAGFFRALREVPLAVEIAQHLYRHSPKGRIVNFTNPMSVITASMARHSKVHGVIGLCHAIVGARDFLAKLYKVDPARMEVMSAGVNHLTWVMQILIDGHDHTDRLDTLLAGATSSKGKVADFETQHFAVSLSIWRRYGFLPIAGDEHVCEFFPQFTRRGSREVSRLRLKPFSGMQKRREKMKNFLANWAYRKEPLPDMDKWSGEDAHSVVLAMLDGDNSRHTVNMPHDGALGTGIDLGAMVECMASVDRRGARGVALGDLPPVVKSMTQRLNAVHDLTVEAALEGDRKKVIQALLLDPSVVEFDRVPAIVDEYLKHYKRYLPRFWQ
jgi:alpha-galactosidase